MKTLHTQIGNMRGVGQCYLIYVRGGPLLYSAEHTHTHTQHRNRDDGLIKAAHSSDFFPFLLTLAPLNVTRSCSENAANFHPHPPQPCTFLPHQQGGQVFCTKHARPPAAARLGLGA